jgi:hypothetical protein
MFCGLFYDAVSETMYVCIISLLAYIYYSTPVLSQCHSPNINLQSLRYSTEKKFPTTTAGHSSSRRLSDACTIIRVHHGDHNHNETPRYMTFLSSWQLSNLSKSTRFYGTAVHHHSQERRRASPWSRQIHSKISSHSVLSSILILSSHRFRSVKCSLVLRFSNQILYASINFFLSLIHITHISDFFDLTPPVTKETHGEVRVTQRSEQAKGPTPCSWWRQC